MYAYTRFYGEQLPATGWKINGKFVHTLNAFKNDENWFKHFCKMFPEKSLAMKEYSQVYGWSHDVHVRHWINGCVQYLIENAESV